jgi:hypothetical protein
MSTWPRQDSASRKPIVGTGSGQTYVSRFEILKANKQRLIPTAGCSKYASTSVAQQLLLSDEHAPRNCCDFQEMDLQICDGFTRFQQQKQETAVPGVRAVCIAPCWEEYDIFLRRTLKRVAELQQLLDDGAANRRREPAVSASGARSAGPAVSASGARSAGPAVSASGARSAEPAVSASGARSAGLTETSGGYVRLCSVLSKHKRRFDLLF